MQNKKLIIPVLFCVLLFAVAAWPQATGGSMRGTVLDNEGKPLPGATVTVSSPDLLGGSRTAYTNELGVFRFPTLPVGTYSVQVEMEGFDTVQVQRVQVNLDATANVPVSLKLQTRTEEITVVGETPVIDVTEAGVQSNYRGELLEEVPTQRTFTDLMQASPGVSASTGDSNGDRTIAFGSNMQSNSWNMDGMDTTAPETGSVWLYPNIDAVEEIQVIGVGAPAEYGNHLGAVFNVVTKKGGNEFHGGANYYFQHDSLTGANVELPDVQGDASHFNRDLYRNFSATLGGPIKRDRLWFFGAYEHSRDASTEPGVPPDIATTGKSDRYDVKLTGLASDKHELMGFYHYEDWVSPDSASQFITPSATYQERGQDHGWGGGLTSTLTNNLLFEARYAGWTTHDLSDSPTGSLEPAFFDYTPADGGPALYSGGPYYPFDYITSRHQVNGKATYYAEEFLNNQHEFRFGVQYSRGNAETQVAAGASGYYNYSYYYPGYGLYYYRGIQLPFEYGAITHDLGFFLDDTVTIGDRLTLNLGVRFDHNTGDIPEYRELAVGTPSITEVGNFIETGRTFPGVHVMTWNRVSPRLGFVYQTRKDGRAILQGSFGVYYDHNVSGNWDYPSPSTTAFQLWLYDPVTNQVTDLIFEQLPGNNSFDPDIAPPRTLQYSVGYENQFTDDIAAGVQYVYKDTKDLIGWEILGGEWAPHPFVDPFTGQQYELLDLVSSPTLRKGNDPGTIGVDWFDNLEYFQKYHAVLFTFNKKFSNNYAVNASYTWSRSTGLIPRMLSQTQFNPFYGSTEGSDPNHFVNADGRLQGDRPHMFRAQAVFLNLPWDLQLSTAIDISSGRHHVRQFRAPLEQGRTSVILERNFRLSPIQSVDVTVGKRFYLTNDFQVRLEGTIFNLFNADNELSIADLRLSEGEEFVPDFWTKPRRLQVRLGILF